MKLLAVGDLILDQPQIESYFDRVAPTLRSGDLVIGQGEVVFTSRGVSTFAELMPSPPIDPANMNGFSYAGFNVITLAGNHIWDSGAPGIEDTVTGLRERGIAVTGAGMNIDEARIPAIIERDGVRFGFLSYNCVGPRGSWAAPDKPGCAYVQIISDYQLEMSNPGGPPTCYTFAEPGSLKAMEDDVKSLRPLCDVLVVSFHKGLLTVPAKLAMYDLEVSHAAIDAGADLILGHHAHILKGIEFYRGKAIFHGLGNFVTVTPALTAEGETNWGIKQAMMKMADMFGYTPDLDDPTYPFHPDGKKTIIAKCTIEDGRITQVGYIPSLISKQGQPEVLKHDARGQQIFDYMDHITRKAGLSARFEWDGDEVVAYSELEE